MVQALRRSSILVLIGLAASVASAAAAELLGKVVSIQDGDTLNVLVDRKQVRVHLVDIDAPEKKQAFGNRSRQSLAELCAGKQARVLDQGQDRYSRTLGRVYCSGMDANAEQVRRGMAWVFERYAPRDSPYHALQSEARQSKRGLWADQRAMPPWEWRASTRNNR
jgi:endonuclease YncB( thermonuclease family)